MSASEVLRRKEIGDISADRRLRSEKAEKMGRSSGADTNKKIITQI
jgi:hypothetical protein